MPDGCNLIRRIQVSFMMISIICVTRVGVCIWAWIRMIRVLLTIW